MKKNPWFRFLILQCCAVTVSVSQLKVSAVMAQVAQGFSISMGAAAGLMSFFTVAGIVLAIPGAALMERMGAKRLLLLLMDCLFAGNAVGAVAGAYPLLMAGRLLEGVAYAMIIMVGIDLINTWFPHGGAGTATGIFNTFAAVGNFITLNGALMVVKRWNVRTLWWIGAALAAVDLILVLAFIPAEKPIPDRSRNRENDGNTAASSTGDMVREAFRDKRLMSLGAAQMLMAFILFGFITCYPLLFTGYYHLAPEKANFYSSLNGLFGIPACIVSSGKDRKSLPRGHGRGRGNRYCRIHHADPDTRNVRGSCAGQRCIPRRTCDDLHLLHGARHRKAKGVSWLLYGGCKPAVLHGGILCNAGYGETHGSIMAGGSRNRCGHGGGIARFFISQ